MARRWQKPLGNNDNANDNANDKDNDKDNDNDYYYDANYNYNAKHSSSRRQRISARMIAVAIAITVATTTIVTMASSRSFIACADAFSSAGGLSLAKRAKEQEQPHKPSSSSTSTFLFGTNRIATALLASTPASMNRHRKEATTDDSNDNDDILARLFGSTKARDDFFANDFANNVVHVRRSTSGNNIRDLDLPCIVDCSSSDGDSSTAATNTKINMRVLFDSSNYVALRKRGSMAYLDKNETTYDEFRNYIRNEKGSAVIPVAEDNALVPFRNLVEASVNRHAGLVAVNATDTNTNTNTNNGTTNTNSTIQAGINVYHSGPGAVALNRHLDNYDVLVLQLDGHKDWEIGVFAPGYAITPAHLRDPKSIDRVQHWTNATLQPGDVLYLPKGVYHAATTADGYDSTTHATIQLEY